MLERLRYRTEIITDKIPGFLTGEKSLKELATGYEGDQELRADEIIFRSVRRRSMEGLLNYFTPEQIEEARKENEAFLETPEGKKYKRRF